MQKTFGRWEDILLFLALVYYSLVFYGILGFPSEKWRISTEIIKASKWNVLFQILIPLMLVFSVLKIFSVF